MPKEELTDSLSELIEFLSNYKDKNNVNNFIGILEQTTKNVQKYVFPKRWFIGFLCF